MNRIAIIRSGIVALLLINAFGVIVLFLQCIIFDEYTGNSFVTSRPLYYNGTEVTKEFPVLCCALTHDGEWTGECKT